MINENIINRLELAELITLISPEAKDEWLGVSVMSDCFISCKFVLLDNSTTEKNRLGIKQKSNIFW